MKNIFWLLLFITQFLTAQTAQNTDIKVIYSMKNEGSKKLAFKLQIDNNVSRYSSLGDLQVFIENISKSTSLDGKSMIFKNYDDRKMFSNETILGQKFLICDSLQIMKWELTDEKTDIVNLSCSSAVTTFRGRKYKAFYSNKILVSDGPWKFFGLPGLIVKIESLDGSYGYEAISIYFDVKKNDSILTEYNELKNKNQINWNQYTALFIQKYDQHIKFLKSTNDSNSGGNFDYFKYNRPEIIYQNLQTGDGIKY